MSTFSPGDILHLLHHLHYLLLLLSTLRVLVSKLAPGRLWDCGLLCGSIVVALLRYYGPVLVLLGGVWCYVICNLRVLDEIHSLLHHLNTTRGSVMTTSSWIYLDLSKKHLPSHYICLVGIHFSATQTVGERLSAPGAES